MSGPYATVKEDSNGWDRRHNDCVRLPKGGQEIMAGAIVTALQALEMYAKAYKQEFPDYENISNDGVLGDYWLDAVKGLHGLLDGPTGRRFDCGTISSWVFNMRRENGFDDSE